MKLRLRGDSLRLRLDRSDVAGLMRTGRLDEAVALGAVPAERLVYSIRLVPGGLQPSTSFADHRIVVELPETSAREWAGGSAVGIYSDTAWGLRIAIEKDFKCLENRTHEDDSDAFEHPGGPVDCLK